MSEPKFIDTPKGDELVILTRADYDALVAARDAAEAAEDEAQDEADMMLAATRVAEWEAAGRPAFPLEVVRFIRSGDAPLRAFRRHRALTQSELAAKAGIGQGHLSDIEKGRRAAGPETLAALAAALGVTVASLAQDL